MHIHDWYDFNAVRGSHWIQNQVSNSHHSLIHRSRINCCLRYSKDDTVFRSLLAAIGMKQTVLFEDNNGALLMVNAQQPAKHTRHINIKQFTLLDWVELDMLLLHEISTHDNAADAMTKPLTCQLFYRHYDTYMGIRIPRYCTAKQTNTPLHPLYSSAQLNCPTNLAQLRCTKHGGY
jgi:hypothetical protein